MPESVVSTTIHYFVIYPNGQRRSVTQESIEAFSQQWAAEGLKFETHAIDSTAPVFGTLQRWTRSP